MEKMKEFMEKHYDHQDLESLPFVRSILLDEWKTEVKAMVELANIEISEMIPVNPEVHHWLDQYYKKMIGYIDTKVKQLEEKTEYNKEQD